MSKLSLPTEAMVSISGRWLDADDLRPAIKEHKLTRALLELLTDAHEALLEAQQRTSAVVAELESFQARLAEADALHDRKARGLHNLLTGLANLDPEGGYAALRDHLFPDGLRIINRSYAEQHGASILLEERLERSHRKQLEAIPTPDGDLDEEVQALIEAARSISRLERERQQVAEDVHASTVSRGDIHQARLDWVRAANALEANLALTDTAPDTRSRILQPLHDAEALAERGSGPDDADPEATG